MFSKSGPVSCRNSKLSSVELQYNKLSFYRLMAVPISLASVSGSVLILMRLVLFIENFRYFIDNWYTYLY